MTIRVLPWSVFLLSFMSATIVNPMFHNVSPQAAQYEKEKRARSIIFHQIQQCPFKFLSNNDRRLADEVPADCIGGLLNFLLNCDDTTQKMQAQELLCLGLKRLTDNALSDKRLSNMPFPSCSDNL